jgi:2-dehydro-3-deoxygluconokinase
VELVSAPMGLRVAAIGECMLEVACLESGVSGARAQLGFGGDTLNTALYLARLGVDVDYHTVLGDDADSDALVAAWRSEGIGVDAVERLAGGQPGLYLVRTDAAGERSFRFWRRLSPARELCTLPGWPDRARSWRTYDWLYFSAITLSILDEASRAALLDAVRAAREAGVRVAFDGNYRPRHWADASTARAVISHALNQVDWALPTFDDEQALFGDLSPQLTLERLARHGVQTAAVKLGAAGCMLKDRHGVRRIAAPSVTEVVDTTAAGDAFNAGFLAGLLGGDSPERAALRGHRIAGIVIGHRGAIAPRLAMPENVLKAPLDEPEIRR